MGKTAEIDLIERLRNRAKETFDIQNAGLMEKAADAITEARKREIKVRWKDTCAFIGNLYIGDIMQSDHAGNCWDAYDTLDRYIGTFAKPEARAAVEAAIITALTERETE